MKYRYRLAYSWDDGQRLRQEVREFDDGDEAFRAAEEVYGMYGGTGVTYELIEYRVVLNWP